MITMDLNKIWYIKLYLIALCLSSTLSLGVPVHPAPLSPSAAQSNLRLLTVPVTSSSTQSAPSSLSLLSLNSCFAPKISMYVYSSVSPLSNATSHVFVSLLNWVILPKPNCRLTSRATCSLIQEPTLVGSTQAICILAKQVLCQGAYMHLSLSMSSMHCKQLQGRLGNFNGQLRGPDTFGAVSTVDWISWSCVVPLVALS